MTEPAAKTSPVLVKPLPIVLGVLAGLGLAILLSQYGVARPTLMLLLSMAVVGGLAIGIALPSLILAILRSKAQRQEVAK